MKKSIRIVVTAGPTREHLDPVRFLSNPSTGKMGFAIAAAAAGGRPRADDLALARTLACLILQRYVAQLRAAPESVGHAGKTDAMIVAEAVQWLERHFAEKIDVSQLVAYIGYSRSRLFEIFKKHAGLSPGDWLMRYRIKRAREMLATDEPAISDISAACGFSSPQYFNYVFKKQTGATPSEWRAAHSKNG